MKRTRNIAAMMDLTNVPGIDSRKEMYVASTNTGCSQRRERLHGKTLFLTLPHNNV
jgi:hypothetical protein